MTVADRILAENALDFALAYAGKLADEGLARLPVGALARDPPIRECVLATDEAGALRIGGPLDGGGDAWLLSGNRPDTDERARTFATVCGPFLVVARQHRPEAAA
jgi:hypothetical protein